MVERSYVSTIETVIDWLKVTTSSYAYNIRELSSKLSSIYTSLYKLLGELPDCDKDEVVDKNTGSDRLTYRSMQILTSEQGEIRMNKSVYKKVCSKVGHEWAFKDEGEWVLKKCLNCGMEQYFFPEEVE